MTMLSKFKDLPAKHYIFSKTSQYGDINGFKKQTKIIV